MEVFLTAFGLVATTVLGVLSFRRQSKLDNRQIERAEIEIKKLKLEDTKSRIEAAAPKLEEKACDIYKLCFSEDAFEKTLRSGSEHPFVDKFATFPIVRGTGALGGAFLKAFGELGKNEQIRVRVLMRDYLAKWDTVVGTDESVKATLPAAAEKFGTVASRFQKFND